MYNIEHVIELTPTLKEMDKHTCKNKMQLCKNPISCQKNKKPYKLILLVLSVHSLNLQGDHELKFPSFSSKNDGCNINVDSATNNKKVTWALNLS